MESVASMFRSKQQAVRKPATDAEEGRKVTQRCKAPMGAGDFYICIPLSLDNHSFTLKTEHPASAER
jgi:hypothetical protein